MMHLVVNESYSAIPLFRYSVFRVLQAPICMIHLILTGCFLPCSKVNCNLETAINCSLNKH